MAIALRQFDYNEFVSASGSLTVTLSEATLAGSLIIVAGQYDDNLDRMGRKD